MKTLQPIKGIVLFLLILIPAFTLLHAQELPRRVYLGIRMENLTDDLKRIMDLDDQNGVLISEVLPASTALKAGFLKGDILIVVNNSPVHNTAEVLSALSGHKGGETFSYELLRSKKKVQGNAVFQTFPEEKYDGLDVIYADAKSAIGLQRIIITKPVGKKRLPAVVYIGGIGCYSLDFPLDSNRNEGKLVTDLNRAGFLCARLEKPGMGDNAGHCKPCAEVSFTEETDGYVAAIEALKLRPDVDSNAIYIFGHSMGGVFAPLIAQRTDIKGIIAYGTLGSNFIEYLAKTRRTIAEANAMSPEETDEMIKDVCECSGYYLVDKMTKEEAARKKPACREYLSLFDLRSRAYNDELYALNIPALWKSYSGKALLLWGESDYISSKDDHDIIAKTINFYHPEHANFLTIKKASHALYTAPNFSDARRNDGPYNTDVSSTVIHWLGNIH